MRVSRGLHRLVPAVLALTVLTGCWGRHEVNDIAIVTATALDSLEEGDLRMTLLLAVPRLVGTASLSGGGGESKLESSAGWIVTAQGNTVMEAYRNIQAKLPRKLFFSHNRVVIVGEKLARQGILTILDYFERNRQSQINSYILVAKEEAHKILSFKPKFEKLTSEIVKEEMKNEVGVSVRMGRFLALVMEEGVEPYAPQVSVVSSADDGAAESDPLSNLMATKATAAFRRDKLVGWLNDNETRGLLWISNSLKGGVMTVKLPPNIGKGFVSAEVTRGRSRMKPHLGKDGIRMQIDAWASLNLYENASTIDIGSARNREILTSLFEDDLEELIGEACNKAQNKLNTDILGFGQAIFRKDPKAWRTTYAPHWDSLFPKVKVDVRASIQIVQTGLVGKDLKREDRS